MADSDISVELKGLRQELRFHLNERVKRKRVLGTYKDQAARYYRMAREASQEAEDAKEEITRLKELADTTTEVRKYRAAYVRLRSIARDNRQRAENAEAQVTELTKETKDRDKVIAATRQRIDGLSPLPQPIRTRNTGRTLSRTSALTQESINKRRR